MPTLTDTAVGASLNADTLQRNQQMEQANPSTANSDSAANSYNANTISGYRDSSENQLFEEIAANFHQNSEKKIAASSESATQEDIAFRQYLEKHRASKRSNFISALELPERWRIATQDTEQEYQRRLMEKRKGFGGLWYWYQSRKQNRDLMPDVQHKWFDGAAYKYVEDVFINASLAQTVRSAVWAYGHDRDYQSINFVARGLVGIGKVAEGYDNSPMTLAEEIEAARNSPLSALMNNADQASDMLDKFVHGQLEINPKTTRDLHQYLSGMAQICEEHAHVLFAKTQDSDDKKPEKGESDYIRDVLHRDMISSPRQAQILMGFVSAILVNASKPLGTEGFIPPNEIVMKPEKAVNLARFITDQMQHRNLVPNISLGKQDERPFLDLPAGAMIRAIRNEAGDIIQYQKISERELLEFSNIIKGQLTSILGNEYESALRFVDSNFEDIENAVASSKQKMALRPIPVWSISAPRDVSSLPNSIKNIWQSKNSFSIFNLMDNVERTVKVALKYQLRPAALYEQAKLFRRAAITQVLSYPVKLTDDFIRATLRPGRGLDMFLHGAKEIPGEFIYEKPDSTDKRFGKDYFNKDNPEGKKVFIAVEAKDPKNIKKGEDTYTFTGKAFKDKTYVKYVDKKKDESGAVTEKFKVVSEDEMRTQKDFMKRAVKNKALNSLHSIISSSLMTVSLMELIGVNKALTADKVEHASPVLTAAIKAGHQQVPALKNRVEKTMNGLHPTLAEVLTDDRYKNDIPRIMKSSPEERSVEDYQLMKQYYIDLSNVCLSMSEEALSPFGVHVSAQKVERLGEVITRVLREPVKNVPDAMIALSYIDSFMKVSTSKHTSIDFVNPYEILIQNKDLGKLGDFISNEMKKRDLKISTGKEGSFAKGVLLEKDSQSGQYVIASGETIIDFANNVTNQLKAHVDLSSLLYAVKGDQKEQYLKTISKHLFKDHTFNVLSEKAEKKLPESDGLTEFTKPWEGKISRKQKGFIERCKENYRRPEALHERLKLLMRSLGETFVGLVSGLAMGNLVYGDKIAARHNVTSAFYKALIYPNLQSTALVAVQEGVNELLFGKNRIVTEADISGNLMQGAIKTAMSHDKNIRTRLMENAQVNANLLDITRKLEFKDIARIKGKPLEFRTEEDNKAMARFISQSSEKIVDMTTSIFQSLGQGKQSESLQDIMERSLQKPVDNIEDAITALALAQGIIKSGADQIMIMAYINPEKRHLKRTAIDDISKYVNDQAALAGFAMHGVPVKGQNGNDFTVFGKGEDLQQGELLKFNHSTATYERASEADIIRFANVTMSKIKVYMSEEIKKDSSAVVERYNQQAKQILFKNMKTPPDFRHMGQAEVDSQFAGIIAKNYEKNVVPRKKQDILFTDRAMHTPSSAVYLN